ncbi:hypothetical protein [Cupriavidus consociatus]|uniref:hypothetical protein n=1 Tax=Cupriavidus consociatus TaxID=2821357 RepID=UPI001AE1A62B|nr:MULTISPECIES: hypothetical protein [unclassified Cupriavidus]MBP0621590.1 hypothetical protein [Cupriavidus sp. LEh25]MDK2658263.1 hypothetical protein [Cupriavidus sp. LEh21]
MLSLVEPPGSALLGGSLFGRAIKSNCDPRWIVEGQLREDAVLAGYGFEALPAEVLAEVSLPDEDGSDPSDADIPYLINPVLLPLLAYPHYAQQRRQNDPPRAKPART